ncbi:MAG: hypothetical protein ACUVWP_07800 [bacterium]
MPEYPIFSLRGGFGNVLRKITCTHKKLYCHQCLLLSSCHFGYIFSTPPQRDTIKLSNIQDIPRLYVLRHGNETWGEHYSDEITDFEQVVIGKAIYRLQPFHPIEKCRPPMLYSKSLYIHKTCHRSPS